MKKLLTLTAILLLCACSAKREDFYSLSFDGNTISVGYDKAEVLEGIEGIDSYGTYLNDKQEAIISKLVIYLNDLNSPLVMIDERPLSSGIMETCLDLDGELIEKNGYVCLIGKEVGNKENYIMIYGDILDDDLNRIDRIEVYYDYDGS